MLQQRSFWIEANQGKTALFQRQNTKAFVPKDVAVKRTLLLQGMLKRSKMIRKNWFLCCISSLSACLWFHMTFVVSLFLPHLSFIWYLDITKTCPYKFYPLKLHFHIIKLGFTGVYIIFHISAQKHRLWVRVRTPSPRRVLRVPSIYVLSNNMKNIRIFYL